MQVGEDTLTGWMEPREMPPTGLEPVTRGFSVRVLRKRDMAGILISEYPTTFKFALRDAWMSLFTVTFARALYRLS